MQIIEKKIPMNCNIFLYGDDHEGTSMRHDDGWDSMIDKMTSEYEGIPEKHNFAVDHGDIIEAIKIDDPRYDGLTSEGNIAQQVRQAIRNRLAFSEKIICILEGNHPLKLWRYQWITKDVCKELGVQYGTWSAKITYNNYKNKIMFKHFCTHGRTNINSAADDPMRVQTNLKLSLKRKLKHKAGDTLLMTMGHTHKMIYAEPTPQLIMMDDGESIIAEYTGPRKNYGYIHPDYRHYVNTGSFFKLYGELGVSSYAEIAGYDPVELGYWVVLVRDGSIIDIKKEIV